MLPLHTPVLAFRIVGITFNSLLSHFLHVDAHLHFRLVPSLFPYIWRSKFASCMSSIATSISPAVGLGEDAGSIEFNRNSVIKSGRSVFGPALKALTPLASDSEESSFKKATRHACTKWPWRRIYSFDGTWGGTGRRRPVLMRPGYLPSCQTMPHGFELPLVESATGVKPLRRSWRAVCPSMVGGNGDVSEQTLAQHTGLTPATDGTKGTLVPGFEPQRHAMVIEGRPIMVSRTIECPHPHSERSMHTLFVSQHKC